ncbi:MAG: acetylxylan esterase [Planctomycetaceae bacterium]|nr:acetylxylan esterase [Planctomycetaceae bacterium]
MLRTLAALLFGLLLLPLAVTADDVSRIAPAGSASSDARLSVPLRTLNDKTHPWSPPTSRAAWEQQVQRIREQLQVACGLWPMPERTTLQPVIHGKIERDGYTVERVFFASRPGHYVTGSLYRPTQVNGKVPGVLCPHGHWQNGRFYDAGDEAAKEQIASGAEQFESGAHSPLQARMVQLARMGCVVFHYDMIGNADSQPLVHASGFNDATAELWLQNNLGLQTWNSIRALDFLTSLPDVDTSRIGVTGASGGGTQTFMLCALDPRPTVAFPAVMVSTAMQGGCACENASYLRQGINNVTIAAMFAPKPMSLSGANDWTIDIETKGLPELKQVYSLFGHPELVDAHCYPQFGHNYNQVAREQMFDWFNQHLGLNQAAPVKQTDFTPLTRDELTVFNAEHPVPADALTADKLRELMTAETQSWFNGFVPENREELAEYRRVLGTAARVMLDEGVPTSVSVTDMANTTVGSTNVIKGYVTRNAGDKVPFVVLVKDNFDGNLVLWIDGAGKSHLFGSNGQPTPAVQKLVDSGKAVVSCDLLLTGEAVPGSGQSDRAVNDKFPGYTFGYNRPLLAERVRDVLTLVGSAASRPEIRGVHLIATGGAGPVGALASAVAGTKLASATIDLQGFTFASVSTNSDPNLLPGALRYGDIDGLLSLAAPLKLTVYGAKTDPSGSATTKVYNLAGGSVTWKEGAPTGDDLAELLK